MNIIFFSHYFPPEGNAPASRTYENCRYWVKKGNRVTVITGVPNVPDGIIYKGYRNKLFQWETMDGIKVLRVWTYIAPNKGIFRRTVNYISYMLSALQAIFLAKKANVVIATSPQFFCAISGFLYSIIKRCPYIFEVRDIWPESLIAVNSVSNSVVIGFFAKIEQMLYHYAKKIIVVTDAFKKIIHEKGIPDSKIIVIKNGVDLKLFQPTGIGAEMRKGYELHDKFIISYIGTIGMAHALDIVLKVAEYFVHRNDFLFLIVGSGAEYQKLAKEKEIKGLKNVLLLGRQPKKKIPAFYEAADVCLVTLRKTMMFRNVLPSKMFEIMAMAKPMILAVDGEARVLLEEAKAGIYVTPEDDVGLRKAIQYLNENPDKRTIAGKNGRAFVEKYFDRDILAEHYLRILKDV